ncbi:DNA internalization-related competence protein ComEC/Rec2 [Vagococcus entomophilus]|uniref:DNA internalization-related competence protein ComEC/Rec2 n=1 Tax=Vagococcus entomophilus TaxID=1160095 RepID=A0A430AFJ1_9ENTE|nr:DNA internalization-related competence protein ComEC/Rec2 [Vagococcus entomophilus]RSU06484.1 DNA internalization-related competence protein ComEC/Rec2 [Vagococcus entomophilus]
MSPHFFRKFSQTLAGNSIFLAFTLLTLLLFQHEPSVLSASILGYFCVRLYTTRLQVLRVTCLIVGCFFIIFIQVWCYQVRLEEKNLPVGKIETICEVLPDTIQIDGDYVQWIGKVKQAKVQAHYVLKNQKEKNYWQKIATKQKIFLQGTVSFPDEKRNLHGFDYRSYLKTKGVYRILEVEMITAMDRQKVAFFTNPFDKIREFRKQMACHIESAFQAYPSIIMYQKQLILGMMDENSYVQATNLRKLGISYLFFVSGMHVLFFVATIRYLFLRIGLTLELTFWIEILVLTICFLLTGLAVGVGKSCFQRTLQQINRRFRWGFSALDIWSLTLIVCLIVKPLFIFQLSGVVTFSVSFFRIYLSKMKKKKTTRLFRKWQLNSQISFCMIPFLAFFTYEYSFFSIFLVFVFGQIVRLSVFPISIGLFLSSFSINVAFLKGILIKIDKMFQGIEKAVEALSTLPNQHLVIGQITPVQLLLFLILILFYLSAHKKESWRWKRIGYLFTVFVGLLGGKYLNPNGKIAFIDVGQGDALFIQLPFFQGNYLVDTGGKLPFIREKWQDRKKQRSNASYTLFPFLKSMGVSTLDKVLITHADLDHMGDLEEMSSQVKIKELVYPKGTTNKKSFDVVTKKLIKGKVRQKEVLAGERIELRNLLLYVLHPKASGNGENNDSLVSYLKIKKTAFLLVGDLEEPGEQELIKNYPKLQIDCLKVGHHGSRTSSSEAFLKQLGAKTAIISCGKNNRFGHPHKEIVSRIQKYTPTIYRTDVSGMLYYEWNFWGQELSPVKSVKKDE